jgi:hypothetical protein
LSASSKTLQQPPQPICTLNLYWLGAIAKKKRIKVVDGIYDEGWDERKVFENNLSDEAKWSLELYSRILPFIYNNPMNFNGLIYIPLQTSITTRSLCYKTLGSTRHRFRQLRMPVPSCGGWTSLCPIRFSLVSVIPGI